MTDADIVRDFLKVARENKPTGQWLGPAVLDAIERIALSPPASTDRDAYEGAREDLLDWKGRAQRAEARLRSLGWAGIDASEPPASAAVVPDGWCLVPLVPTEDMVAAGFESEPDACFSPLESWLEYEAMTGCRQAAHRAKLCYAAMLAATPSPPVGEKGEGS